MGQAAGEGKPGRRRKHQRGGAARAQAVGPAGWYLARPGFAWGGIGVAACWHGSARGLQTALRRVADLELYVRLHHAERDLSRLGSVSRAAQPDEGIG
jgi:hypothetical protein